MNNIKDNKWKNGAIPALLIHCSIGTVYCWSCFSNALAKTINVSQGVLNWSFSFAIFFLGMSAAFCGKFVEKNIKKSSLISCLCFCIGLFGVGLVTLFHNHLSHSTSVLLIYLFYGCIMGIGLGIGYITPVKTLMLWFNNNKGLATGISIMGFGLAKAIASPIMNYMQENIGLAAMFFTLSIAYFICMILAHFLIKKPSWYNENKETKPSIKIKDVISDKVFIGIWVCFYINITCGLALISYEKPFLSYCGFALSAISIIQIITAISNSCGRIYYATITDTLKKINRKSILIYEIIFITCIIVSAISFYSGFISRFGLMIVIALLVIVNMGYGGGFSTLPIILEEYYGMNYISTIHGLALSAWAFAGLTGNQITSFCLKFGYGYRQTIFVIMILYCIALFITIIIKNIINKTIQVFNVYHDYDIIASI